MMPVVARAKGFFFRVLCVCVCVCVDHLFLLHVSRCSKHSKSLKFVFYFHVFPTQGTKLLSVSSQISTKGSASMMILLLLVTASPC